jgi:hypothetical protein
VSLTITVQTERGPDIDLTPAQQVEEALAAIGFTRAFGVQHTRVDREGAIWTAGDKASKAMPEPSVLSVSDEPKAAAQPMPSVLDERSVQEHVKRERGKPSPGRKRRTAEEVAEDEAAAETSVETAEIVHEVAAEAEAIAEPAAISTGDTRVGPEDEPEEDQIQDIADEHAEVAATAVPDAPATLEDVRAIMGAYSHAYGLPAVQVDGQVIVKEVLGEPPAGVPNWKMTAFPEDKYGAIVAAFKAATESNRFGREKV